MGYIRNKYVFHNSILNQINTLRVYDNWHGLIAVLYDYLIIYISVLFFHSNAWLYPVSLILIGSRQRALATLLHESAHCCLAKSRKLNYFIGTFLSGYLIFQEYYTYRDSHVKRHHAYLGDDNKDPDYIYHIHERLYNYSGCISFFGKFVLKPILLFNTISYLGYLIRTRMRPSRQYVQYFFTMYSYWTIIIGAAFYYNLELHLLLFWIIPLITTSVVIGWFNELSEHYPLVKKNKIDLYMTRNRFSHWLEDFIFNTHAESFHLVHHLFPTIPFWKLKKAHKILCEDIQYLKANENCGGIFISSNQRPSLMFKLLSNPSVTLHGHVQYE